jgi:hypothetical protein
MASDVRTGRRERAEMYALEAADAARRGDHRKAAALYQAAFIALESNDEDEALDEFASDGRAPEQQQAAGQSGAQAATDRPDEAE